MSRKVLIQIRRGLEANLGTLAQGELGYCTDSRKLYIGTASGNQLIVNSQTVGDMLKAVYDTNNDGKVDVAEVADSVPWTGVTGRPNTYNPSAHEHVKTHITDFPTAMPADGGNADTVDGKHASDFVPASHVGSGGSAHQAATTSVAGFMSASDKSKLNGIEAGANKYTHPSTHSLDMITETTAKKIMTSDERTKLAAVEAGANKYTLPTASSTVLGGVKVGSRLTISSGVLSADTQTDNNFTNALKTKLDGIEAGAQVNKVTSVAGKTGAVSLTRSDVGLGNVDNTSDANKPISIAVQAALDNKVDNSRVLTDVPAGAKFTDTVTTINGKTGAIAKADIVALGIPAQDTVYTHPSSHPASIITESTTRRFVSDSEKSTWNAKETTAGAQAKVDAHANRVDNPHSVTKSQVGLGSVANYSIATQAEAQAGTSSSKYMTPLRTKEAIGSLESVKSVNGKTGSVFLASSDVGAAPSGHGHTLDSITETASKKIMTSAERTKLAGIEAGANKYVHPTGDGFYHVPAVGAGNAGKVLTAGATAGAFSWEALPIGGGEGGGLAPATVVVAANNSLHKDKADFVVPDGATNAEVTINAAINSLPVDGGRVLLLEGLYATTEKIFMKENVVLEGQGRGTIIRLDSAGYINDQGALVGSSNTVIRSMTIDASNVYGINAIYLSSVSNVTISDLYVVNGSDGGIAIRWCSNITICKNHIENCGDGIYINSDNCSIVGNIIRSNRNGINSNSTSFIIVSDNIIADNSSHGLRSTNTRSSVVSNNSINNNGGSGIWFYYNKENVVNNNLCRKNGEHGIYIYQSERNLVYSNMCIENSQKSNAQYDGICFYLDAMENYVGGNFCHYGTLTNKHRYGIGIMDGLYNFVTNNCLRNSGTTANFYDNGNSTRVTAGNYT